MSKLWVPTSKGNKYRNSSMLFRLTLHPSPWNLNAAQKKCGFPGWTQLGVAIALLMEIGQWCYRPFFSSAEEYQQLVSGQSFKGLGYFYFLANSFFLKKIIIIKIAAINAAKEHASLQTPET